MEELIAKEDKEFIRRAVFNDARKVLLFKQKYITDDIWEMAIDEEAGLFKYIKNPSDNICYYALDADGANLKYINPDRITPKMIAIATRSNKKGATPFIPKKFLANEDTDFYSDFDSGVKSREERQLEMIRMKPNKIKEIENPSEELICEAIKLDPNIYLYFANHTPKMKLVIEEYYPQLTGLFPGFGE